MNFCQKHQNHHCIHAHSCQNKEHKKLNQLKKHSHNQTIAHLHSHKHPQNKCKFVKGISDVQNVNKELLAKLHQSELKICELAHNQTVVKEKCDKLTLQNKHLFAQIEYYRQQFTSLIQNSNVDNKNQIKKRVKESTDFILRIKSLQSENDSLKSQTQKLRQIVQYYKKQDLDHQNKSRALHSKYENTSSKLKQLCKYKYESNEQIISKQKDYDRLHNHYQILKAQFSIQRDQYNRQNKQLHQELEIMKKQFNKYKNLTQKEKQLLVIQKENLMKKQAMYKQKLREFQVANHELKEKMKEIDLRNQELDEDLKYTKQVLQKREEIKGELNILNKELQNKNIQTFERKTQIRQHHSPQKNKQNKPLQDTNTNFNQQNTRLKEQLKKLTQKIIQLQSKSMTNYEQVIMSIGASQAFRRLVQQKNAIIKKLMREKGEIYAKMTVNYN